MANRLQGLIGQPYMLKFNRYELKKPKALWQDIQPTGTGYASLKLCKVDECSISLLPYLLSLNFEKRCRYSNAYEQ